MTNANLLPIQEVGLALVNYTKDRLQKLICPVYQTVLSRTSMIQAWVKNQVKAKKSTLLSVIIPQVVIKWTPNKSIHNMQMKNYAVQSIKEERLKSLKIKTKMKCEYI